MESVGLENRSALRVEPFGSRAVVVQLDAVTVGVSEVNRNRRPVVLGGVYGVSAVQDLPHGAAQLPAAGVEEGEVVESRMPLGG